VCGQDTIWLPCTAAHAVIALNSCFRHGLGQLLKFEEICQPQLCPKISGRASLRNPVIAPVAALAGTLVPGLIRTLSSFIPKNQNVTEVFRPLLVYRKKAVGQTTKQL
jgi:hypothetical protein